MRRAISNRESQRRALPRWPRAFTLPELLVVIAIAILLLAISIPAFSSVLYSSKRSGAAQAVQTALAAARDVALESGPGRDAAAVFFADRGGNLRIMVAVQAGHISDAEESGGGVASREVFVRSDRVEPIRLPTGWAVSGRARANMIGIDRSAGRQTAWYTRQTYRNTDRENWVFPETAVFDLDSGDDGADRQTFMVRFAGGSGAMTYGDDRAVLVLDPAPTRAFRQSSPWSSHDVLDAADLRRYVQRINALREAKVPLDYGKLLGDESSDTVLARPVGQVAVYSLRELARAVGARGLNDATGSLYAATDDPQYDGQLFGGSPPGDLSERVNGWISGQPVAGGGESDAQIFTVQRYLGRPLEAVAIGEAP